MWDSYAAPQLEVRQSLKENKVARTAKKIVDEEFYEGALLPEDSIDSVIQYTLSLHYEEADIGKEVSQLVHQRITNFYPSCTVEIKTWPAPNHEFNIQLSVRKR